MDLTNANGQNPDRDRPVSEERCCPTCGASLPVSSWAEASDEALAASSACAEERLLRLGEMEYQAGPSMKYSAATSEAKRQPRNELRIVVSVAMEEAGEAIYFAFDKQDDDPRELAREIFMAMAAVASPALLTVFASAE